MGEWFVPFVEWMTNVPPLWAYTVILVIAWLENVFPPVPGDLVVVFGGYLVGVGKLQLAPVILLATVGGAVGFMCVYALGRHMGEAIFEKRRFRWLPVRKMRKARVWIHRWGYGAVAANRFLTGARSVISLAVGIAGMRPLWVAVYATVSAGIWCALMALLGYFLGQNWQVVALYLERYSIVVGVLLLVGLVLFGARMYLQRNAQ
jgi:membrane protein DedA with SNARE-associated domain